MKPFLFIAFSVCIVLHSCKQNESIPFDEKSDKAEIESILNAQSHAWNEGSIEKFMFAYLNSEELCFIGSRGITKGWNTTLYNYQKAYPDLDAMGQLSFEVLDLKNITEGSYYMVGRYTLKRKEDMPTGIFMLIWKKVEGEWKIIADQTCG